jgi:hypothetical protein
MTWVGGCSGGGGTSEASAEGYRQAKFRAADFVDGALPPATRGP